MGKIYQFRVSNRQSTTGQQKTRSLNNSWDESEYLESPHLDEVNKVLFSVNSQDPASANPFFAMQKIPYESLN
jgi:hypothetical protein